MLNPPYPEATHPDPEIVKRRKHELFDYLTDSWCLRCGWPDALQQSHETEISRVETGVTVRVVSVYPLCEECWTKLGSPEARIEYYGTLVEYWEKASPGRVSEELKRQIMQAVANGG